MDKTNILNAWLLPQFKTGLFFNTLQGSDGNVPLRVRNSDATLFDGMFELGVTAFSGHFHPAIRLEGRYQRPDFSCV